MNETKRVKLIKELSQQPEPQLVACDKFFDGNDDPGSIGCNLMDHPGIDIFRQVFTQLQQHPKIIGVYFQISELDPGHGWPFTDAAYVLGTLPNYTIRALVEPLQPDEVVTFSSIQEMAEMCIPPDIIPTDGTPLTYIWWD